METSVLLCVQSVDRRLIREHRAHGSDILKNEETSPALTNILVCETPFRC